MTRNSTRYPRSWAMVSAIFWALVVAGACEPSLGDESDSGTNGETSGGSQDTMVCLTYCANVMDCANGWGGGGVQYSSESSCVALCEGYVEPDDGCADAADAYFSCAAGLSDCEDYNQDHAAQCSDLEDSFEGWCLP